ncbi:MAG: phosphoribosyltransferase family protein [Patescibacteria group bacterium]
MAYTFLHAAEIKAAVDRIARQICREFHGQDIVLVGLLRGGFMFLTDLAVAIETQEMQDSDYHVRTCAVEFMKVSSYGDGRESGVVKIDLDLQSSVEGKIVILVDDVADTLKTLESVLRHVAEKKPRTIRIAVMISKPDKHQRTLVLDYVGFERVNAGFLFGYGMDLAGAHRGLPYIAVAEPQDN